MHLHNMVSDENDIERCQAIIKKIMEEANYILSKEELKKLTKEILDTISSLGGDFSSENVEEVTATYIKNNFYTRFKKSA